MLQINSRPTKQVSSAFHIPAPVGGLNSVSPASDMPLTDCVLLTNMVAGEYGLRSRRGYREWCTGITGAGDNVVRSVLPFTGSTSSGSKNRLFACTSSGIWDVSASSASPANLIAFGVQSGNAGYGVSTVMVTAAGHFLYYCDEENGAYLYTEATDSWVQVTQASSVAWAGTTGYALGNRVTNGGLTYKCITAGTSAGSGGPTGTASDITDNTAHWQYEPTINGVDPATLVFAMVWKNRLWFVERDTANAWYMPVSSNLGLATKFALGNRFRAGGQLVGLWSWTIDGGAGIDDSLVAVSGGGDVAIYQGTDPSSASTFGLKGVWYLGGVPSGRHIATQFGGDVLLLSKTGVLPLSRLVTGNPDEASKQYATSKIANLFAVAASTYGNLHGWSLLLHPEDGTLLITVPSAEGEPTTQFAMSLNNRSWSQYRDLPICSAEVLAGKFYFGTEDGRVCVSDGFVDEVLLADPDSYTPVDWVVLTASSASPSKKMVQFIRTTVASDGGAATFTVEPRYDYDLSEPDAPVGGTAAGGWGTGVWGTTLWAGGYTTQQSITGAAGIGNAVAVAVRGTATSRTVLVGFDVTLKSGGML